MSAIMITNPDTGRTFTFLSQEAYECAQDWRNETDEQAMIDYYIERATAPYDRIWADPERTRLTPDWADVVIELYAADYFGAPEI